MGVAAAARSCWCGKQGSSEFWRSSSGNTTRFGRRAEVQRMHDLVYGESGFDGATRHHAAALEHASHAAQRVVAQTAPSRRSRRPSVRRMIDAAVLPMD
ncbi:hypothetical protein EVAR_24807_1 [Eumeta japonica]|uniref:Uncharacterized protein n=1 Tax=Eumeta variegata TaxID=151549 RepID=A0A4C1W2W4_EUMVA|nr:hypothetical protein EVAR_24807_1 [Eumeta japonica]